MGVVNGSSATNGNRSVHKSPSKAKRKSIEATASKVAEKSSFLPKTSSADTISQDTVTSSTQPDDDVISTPSSTPSTSQQHNDVTAQEQPKTVETPLRKPPPAPLTKTPDVAGGLSVLAADTPETVGGVNRATSRLPNGTSPVSS